MLDEIRVDSEYFDSDFHIFYEDLDIAWRAQNSGWRGYYIPSAIAYHIRGGTVRRQEGLDKPYARRYLSDDLYDLKVWGYLLFFRPRLIKQFLTASKEYAKSILRKRELQRSIMKEILKKA